MLTEKGTLPIGVEHDGKTHKDFEIREQLVRDTVAVYDNPDQAKRAAVNDAYAGVCILANQIVSLGLIPKEAITADMVLDMNQDDFKALTDATKRLEERRKSFRTEA